MRIDPHFIFLRDHALLLALAALVTLPLLFGTAGEEWLRYSRSAIHNGEWWRWLTGHLVHLNPAHLGLNLLGLAICGLLVGPGLAGIRGIVVLLGALAACSAGLWLFSPQVQWYVGLSGVLHGLLLGGALGLPASQRRWQWLISAIVVAKLVSEQLQGPSLSTEQLIGHAVIVDAHLYGAVGGAMGWFAYRLSGPLRRRVRNGLD